MSATPGHRARTLAGVVAALALAAGLARYGEGWPVDNRVDSWGSGAGRDEGYELLQERFGGDAAVVFRVDGFDAADPLAGGFVRGLGARLEELAGVRSVFDPLALEGGTGATLAQEMGAARELRVVRALDAVGLAPNHVDLVVGVDPGAVAGVQDALAAGVSRLRTEARAAGLRLRAAGHPLIAAGLDEESRRVDLVFGPLLVVLGGLACAVILRSISLALLTMLPGTLASLGLRAALRALGVDANMILVAGAPLVLVVVVASTLHLTTRFLRRVEAGHSPEPAARSARGETLHAALVAALTTAVGFAAFAFSDVRAVRNLGLAVAAVVALATPLTYLLLPPLLAGLSPRSRTTRPSGRRWRRIAAAAARRRGLVLAGAALVLAAGAAAPAAMPVATDAYEYFPEGHAVREEFVGLEADGVALSTVDVIVRPGPGISPDGREVAELTERLAALAGVRGAVGPADVRADLESRLGRRAAALAAPAVLATSGRTAADGAATLARITVRLGSSRMADVSVADARVRAAAREWQAEGAGEVYVASSLARLRALHDALVETLVTSLSLTGLVALVSFLVVLRGARERLAGVAANLVPVAAALAGARLLGFSLDAATVMVASVVMGLALDTTFHLLLAGRTAPGRDRRGERRTALRAFARVGDAAFTSAVVLCAGFGALALADFAPTARFGLASAMGVAAAFAADLLVVPAIWLRAPAVQPEDGLNDRSVMAAPHVARS